MVEKHFIKIVIAAIVAIAVVVGLLFGLVPGLLTIPILFGLGVVVMLVAYGKAFGGN